MVESEMLKYTSVLKKQFYLNHDWGKPYRDNITCKRCGLKIHRDDKIHYLYCTRNHDWKKVDFMGRKHIPIYRCQNCRHVISGEDIKNSLYCDVK